MWRVRQPEVPSTGFVGVGPRRVAPVAWAQDLAGIPGVAGQIRSWTVGCTLGRDEEVAGGRNSSRLIRLVQRRGSRLVGELALKRIAVFWVEAEVVAVALDTEAVRTPRTAVASAEPVAKVVGSQLGQSAN